MDPTARVKQIFFGYIQTQSVYAAVKIGVPDALSSGPKTAARLSEDLSAHEDTLGRLLNVLVRLGLFTCDEQDRYAHNPASECLRSDHPNSLADLITFCGRESYYTFGNLEASVRSNEAVFERAWDINFWEHLRGNPQRAAIFGRAMERQSESLLSALVAQFDFSAYPHIADIGGGKGQLFRPLAAAGVAFTGTVFDQPSITDLAINFLASAGLEQCHFVGGSFFESVPEGADLYILKFVLHDWSDDRSLEILRTVRKAMKPGSKLMVIELFLGVGPSPWSFLSDMLMLSTFGAKERTDAQFRTLLAEGGFDIEAIEHIAGGHCYALAAPAGE